MPQCTIRRLCHTQGEGLPEIQLVLQHKAEEMNAQLSYIFMYKRDRVSWLHANESYMDFRTKPVHFSMKILKVSRQNER